MMLKILPVLFALSLAACASGAALKDDPVFRTGYDAGCTAAHGGYARETLKVMTEGQPDVFRRGFSAGFAACGGARGGEAGGAVMDDPTGRGR
jgi:hypothetical protein